MCENKELNRSEELSECPKREDRYHDLFPVELLIHVHDGTPSKFVGA